MPECQIPPHHTFLTINMANSEVVHLHKFEQAHPCVMLLVW